MFKTNKWVLIVIIMMLTTITTICYANSAEPPSILIIVPNAPDDLEISIGSGGTYSENNTYSKAKKTDKVIESYYTFYHNDLKINDDYILKITTGGRTFEIAFERPLMSYDNIFTLDLGSQTLTSGKFLSRSIVLVSVRIILTLILESIVFALFCYKQKKSWIAFFIINLITQGGLNIWLNGASPLQSYIIITLIFGEIIIFITEIIGFSVSVKEHGRLRIILYVLTANLISLVLGGYLITLMPI